MLAQAGRAGAAAMEGAGALRNGFVRATSGSFSRQEGEGEELGASGQ